jgi:hypothetical protein
MRYTPFTTLIGLLVLTASPALAQATSTPSGTAPGTAAPGGGTAAGGGGLTNWWWTILVIIVIAAVVWYFMRGRSGRV